MPGKSEKNYGVEYNIKSTVKVYCVWSLTSRDTKMECGFAD